jgi:hypothetical protein
MSGFPVSGRIFLHQRLAHRDHAGRRDLGGRRALDRLPDARAARQVVTVGVIERVGAVHVGGAADTKATISLTRRLPRSIG